MSTCRRLNKARIWFSARRTVAVEATIFGRILWPSTSRTQSSSRADLVQPRDRAQRAGDQVQFVLDHQVRRQEPAARQRAPSPGWQGP